MFLVWRRLPGTPHVNRSRVVDRQRRSETFFLNRNRAKNTFAFVFSLLYDGRFSLTQYVRCETQSGDGSAFERVENESMSHVTILETFIAHSDNATIYHYGYLQDRSEWEGVRLSAESDKDGQRETRLIQPR